MLWFLKQNPLFVVFSLAFADLHPVEICIQICIQSCLSFPRQEVVVKSSFAVVTTAHGHKAESQSGRTERQRLIDEPK